MSINYSFGSNRPSLVPVPAFGAQANVDNEMWSDSHIPNSRPMCSANCTRKRRKSLVGECQCLFHRQKIYFVVGFRMVKKAMTTIRHTRRHADRIQSRVSTEAPEITFTRTRSTVAAQLVAQSPAWRKHDGNQSTAHNSYSNVVKVEAHTSHCVAGITSYSNVVKVESHTSDCRLRQASRGRLDQYKGLGCWLVSPSLRWLPLCRL
jgi:hypothetical protein